MPHREGRISSMKTESQDSCNVPAPSFQTVHGQEPEDIAEEIFRKSLIPRGLSMFSGEQLTANLVKQVLLRGETPVRAWVQRTVNTSKDKRNPSGWLFQVMLEGECPPVEKPSARRKPFSHGGRYTSYAAPTDDSDGKPPLLTELLAEYRRVGPAAYAAAHNSAPA